MIVPLVCIADHESTGGAVRGTPVPGKRATDRCPAWYPLPVIPTGGDLLREQPPAG